MKTLSKISDRQLEVVLDRLGRSTRSDEHARRIGTIARLVLRERHRRKVMKALASMQVLP